MYKYIIIIYSDITVILLYNYITRKLTISTFFKYCFRTWIDFLISPQLQTVFVAEIMEPSLNLTLGHPLHNHKLLPYRNSCILVIYFLELKYCHFHKFRTPPT